MSISRIRWHGQYLAWVYVKISQHNFNALTLTLCQFCFQENYVACARNVHSLWNSFSAKGLSTCITQLRSHSPGNNDPGFPGRGNVLLMLLPPYKTFSIFLTSQHTQQVVAVCGRVQENCNTIWRAAVDKAFHFVFICGFTVLLAWP